MDHLWIDSGSLEKQVLSHVLSFLRFFEVVTQIVQMQKNLNMQLCVAAAQPAQNVLIRAEQNVDTVSKF